MRVGLKWQRYTGQIPPGARLDMFKGAQVIEKDLNDEHVTVLDRNVKLGKGSFAHAAQFSPDGIVSAWRWCVFLCIRLPIFMCDSI